MSKFKAAAKRLAFRWYPEDMSQVVAIQTTLQAVYDEGWNERGEADDKAAIMVRENLNSPVSLLTFSQRIQRAIRRLKIKD